jgi:hypothetical protein
MELLIGACARAESGFNITSLIGPLIALLGVAATIISTVAYGLRTTRRNLRANIISTNRLKWLDLFRAELSFLLAFGERLEGCIGKDETSEHIIREKLRLVSKRIIVLLGREDELRLELAELVRQFARAPTSPLSESIEVLAQKIFREQWNKVRTETGELPRDKSPLPRHGSNTQGPVETESLPP